MNAETAQVPILSWFEGPIKQSIKSVFDGLNAGVESLDLFGKYYTAHIKSLKQDVQYIKLLGMAQPSLLIDLYNPAQVSTSIRRRLFTDVWITPNITSTLSQNKQTIIFGDEYVESRNRVAVLGGPGAGKTTLLNYLSGRNMGRNLIRDGQLLINGLDTSSFRNGVSAMCAYVQQDDVLF